MMNRALTSRSFRSLIPASLGSALVLILGGITPVPAHAAVESISSSSASGFPVTLAQAEGASSDASTMASSFINLLAGGQFSDALQWYDTTASETVSSDSLMTVWRDIEAENGLLQEQLGHQVVSLSPDSYAVIVTCEFEQGTRDLLITFTGDQVVDFSLVQS